MHVKAFGLMTRHPVRLDALPEDLHGEVEADERGRVDRPSREVRGEVFRRFLAALAPLREAEKLGGILMQFPPYVVPKPRSYEYLEWAAVRSSTGTRCSSSSATRRGSRSPPSRSRSSRSTA
jgi:uncharacterized protein YecE (DUF72 family)